MCRTSLETQKLELMSEVSKLKLKLNGTGKDRFDFDRFRDNEVCGLLKQNSSLFSAVFFDFTHTHRHTLS